MPFLSRFYRAACALVVASGLFMAAAPATAQVNPAQRGEIESIIKDYLMKNPEVLRDALIELERRGKAEEADKRTRAVKELAPQIFNSKYQVVLGNPKGKIELVEFFDFNCGYCRRAMTDLITLMKDNPDLRVVLKEFPVLGPRSVEAAQVALAFILQQPAQKYWEFHQRLMLAKGQIGKDQAFAAAKASGADMARLEKDMNGDEVRAALTEILGMADALSLTGTPAYIVGDEIVVGAVGAAQLQAKISNFRKCGKGSCD